MAPSVAVYLTSATVPPRQACTVPDSVSKMKLALPPVIGNVAGAPPNTMPVGPPATVTTSELTAPVAGYSVDVFVPLFEVHHGDVGLPASPHALTRLASARSAGTS